MKVIILALILINSLFAYTGNTPFKLKTSQEVDKSMYSWMIRNKDIRFVVNVTGGSSLLIPVKEIEEHIKLKMQESLSSLRLKKITDVKDISYLDIKVELHKYNSYTDIYYGVVNVRYSPSNAMSCTKETTDWTLSFPISNTFDEIHSNINKALDYTIDKFAEDYYYIKGFN